MSPDQPQTEDDRLQNIDNPLKVMQPGERVLCEIRRHPAGLLGIYGGFGLVIVLGVLVIAGMSYLIPGLSRQNQAIIALGTVLFCALIGLFTYVAAHVYKGNRWIVTTDSITQISQVTLFNRQTSQLSLANLEDVTVQQNGLLQAMLGYGSLHVESAGQRGKFIFDFCPRPNEFARQLIAAHEAYIAENPEEMHTTNRPLANTTSFNQSYGAPQQQTAAQPFDPTQPQPPANQ